MLKKIIAASSLGFIACFSCFSCLLLTDEREDFFCSPDTLRCNGSIVEECSPIGTWETLENCNNPESLQQDWICCYSDWNSEAITIRCIPPDEISSCQTP